MYALIDADILVYRCGFAAQKTYYRLPNVDEEFDNATECKEFCARFGVDYSTKEALVRIEPLENALHNVKTVIEDIIENCECGRDEIELWLSGPTNYRDAVGVTKQYKGNRDPEHKPFWYNEIKDYLVNTWGAKFSINCEADDMLALRYKDQPKLGRVGEASTDTIIVSTDKDLDQVAGKHYNWVKKEMYYVTPEQASKYFWMQMIMGDSTDNIQGIPGMGPKKAEKFLDSLDPFEWESAVVDLYAEAYPDTHRDVFKEHWQLIKMGDEDTIINLTTQKEEENSQREQATS